MTPTDQPTENEIEAAARALFEEGCFYNWWPIATKSYDEFAVTDPVGVNELRGIAERMLTVAAQARAEANPG
jgi:hypothetical protein